MGGLIALNVLNKSGVETNLKRSLPVIRKMTTWATWGIKCTKLPKHIRASQIRTETIVFRILVVIAIW